MHHVRGERVVAAPFVLVMAVAMALAGLSGCQSETTSPTTVTAARTVTAAPAAARPSADDPVNQVLAISVDGLNPEAITKLGPTGAPAFYSMMRRGAYTLNARTEYEMTRTLPNHTGMLTGRRIDAKHGGHGVNVNSDTGKTVHKKAGHYVSSVFDVVHDRGGTTALYAAKTKFAIYPRTWNTHGRADRVGENHGKKKIDRVRIDTDNARLVDKLVRELRAKPPTFTFLHISLPDAAGHKYGFMSPRYMAAVQQTDRLLGTVLRTVDQQPRLNKHLLVMVTADHGGDGAKNHSTASKAQNYRVPFLVWGPGVARGRDLYAINPTFKDPKNSRPGYRGRQPIRNGDVANLATDVLDLPSVPGSKLNRPRTLNVFGK